VVAGHICVDIIPSFGTTQLPLEEILHPGHLTTVGPAVVSTGGAVSNTGLALHRLGVPVRLMGKIGRDLFGEAILGVLRAQDPALCDGMIVSDDPSSYTLVLNPPGIDRMFLHCPGANDTFGASDVALDQVAGAQIFHFGYPPLLRRFRQHEGAELTSLFAAVKATGVVTSLDMSQPDAAAEAGRVDWGAVLTKTLPWVDLFCPSLEETIFMLDRPRYDAMGAAAARQPDGALLHALSDHLLALGAAIVALKLGDQGLYLRTTANPVRLGALVKLLPANLQGWLNRELLTPCFRANVVGTTGAGDCTIAGLLTGMLHGQAVEAVLTGAVAVGACSVEAADATSGVPGWDRVQARLRSGWAHHPLTLDLPGWRSDDGRVWYGPVDGARGSKS
jgi:sugar/nucleoside kinase (ribokinase family)